MISRDIVTFYLHNAVTRLLHPRSDQAHPLRVTRLWTHPHQDLIIIKTAPDDVILQTSLQTQCLQRSKIVITRSFQIVHEL